MANNDFPLYNGFACSWADLVTRAAADGVPIIDVKDIQAFNTGSSVEVGEQKAGGRVMQRTHGDGGQEASLTLYRSGYQKLIRGLKSIAPLRGNVRKISLVIFDLQFMHTPEGSDEIFEVRVKGCRLMGRNLNGSEGPDADVVEVPLNPIEVVDVIDGEEVAML